MEKPPLTTAPDFVPSAFESTAWHALTAEASLELLSSTEAGLAEADAAGRLKQWGPNRWRIQRRTSAFGVLLDQLSTVVVWLLIGAAVAAFIAREYVESLAIAAVLVINTLMGFVIELRARRSMEALLKYETARALVIRDGQRRMIDGHDLVPGDIVEFEAGHRIPADMRLIRADDLILDEAPLTGESLPVDKDADAVRDALTPLSERINMVYAGTSVPGGIGVGVVVATGMATELGRIGGLVASIPETETPLERRLDALGTRLVVVTLALGVLVFLVGIVGGTPLLPMLETAIALAVAAVPEGLPTVATIALAVGLRRMARRNALVRNLHSVEALGSTTVICSDKTGTLTAAEMTVMQLNFVDTEVTVQGAGYDPTGEFFSNDQLIDPQHHDQVRQAATISLLAAKARIERTAKGWSVIGDPTDAALRVFGLKARLDPAKLKAQWSLTEEIPFTAARKYTAAKYESSDHALLTVVKGAPEAVAHLCHQVVTGDGIKPLDEVTRASIATQNERLAAKAMRVIALAYSEQRGKDGDISAGLTFVALAGIADPPAPDAAATIARLQEAGIRTIMVTGDQKNTARAVANGLGMPPDLRFFDGTELAAASDSQWQAVIREAAGFARVTPEQKLAIVTQFQKQGEIVGFLGDGVNDAAALKKADVGVAMGLRGTDVAKETASVVLQDDKFGTIAAAVEEGRTIYDNIRKFIFYLFSCNLAEILVIVVGGIFAVTLPLLPLQILWLNLVTDTFPALALAIEPADRDVMSRPPRPKQSALLSSSMLKSMVFFAALITASTLAAMWWATSTSPSGDARMRTVTFSTLALAQLFHLGNARSTWPVMHWRRALANRYALAAVVLVIALQLIAVYSSHMQRILGTTSLAASDWIAIGALAMIPALVGQLARAWRTRSLEAE